MDFEKYAHEVFELIKEEFKFLDNMDLTINLINSDPKRDKLARSRVIVDYTDKEANALKYTLTLNTFYKEKRVISKEIKARFKEYIEGLGLELDKFIDFIIASLHEIGHLDMFYSAHHLYGVSPHAIANLRDYEFSLLKILFPVEGVVKAKLAGHVVPYRFSLNESYADGFALKHFPRIWNKVKPIVEKHKEEK